MKCDSWVKYLGIAFTVFNVLNLCLFYIGANRNESGVFAARERVFGLIGVVEALKQGGILVKASRM